MAENRSGKCTRAACECLPEQGHKFFSKYCEEAEKSGVIEIGCGCEHTPCRQVNKRLPAPAELKPLGL